VTREIVPRQLDRTARLQFLHVLDHEVRFEGAGMVVVEGGALLDPQIVAVAIITIVVEHGDLLQAQAVDNALHHRGLAGPGAPGHANHKRRTTRFTHSHGLRASPESGDGLPAKREIVQGPSLSHRVRCPR